MHVHLSVLFLPDHLGRRAESPESGRGLLLWRRADSPEEEQIKLDIHPVNTSFPPFISLFVQIGTSRLIVLCRLINPPLDYAYRTIWTRIRSGL